MVFQHFKTLLLFALFPLMLPGAASAGLQPAGQTYVAAAPAYGLQAHAGYSRTIAVGDTVRLDGSASTNTTGERLRYHWQLSTPPGSNARLSDPTAVRPQFTADLLGDYVAQLVISHADRRSAPAAVRISTGNVAPQAATAPDRTVDVGQTILLNATGSTDFNGDALRHRWNVVSAPDGSRAVIDAARASIASFTADRAGEYVIGLIVNDGRLDSTPARLHVSTRQSRPDADAGVAQIAAAGDLIRLDGRRSADSDGDELSFGWSLLHTPARSRAVLNHATSLQPELYTDLPGLYVAQLIVHDGLRSSAPDTVVIEAYSAQSSPNPGGVRGPDIDGDGVLDADDNCVEAFNPDQRDTNGDGFGNICDPDLDNDGVITNFGDLQILKAAFFSTPVAPQWNPDADFNGDDIVNFADLQIMKNFFFGPPGPIGIRFINPNGGSWHDPANWDLGVIPTIIHTAIIDLAAGMVVEFSMTDTTIRGLRTTSELRLTGGSLRVTGNARFNGELTINGGVLKDANILAGTGSIVVPSPNALGILDGVTLGAVVTVENSAILQIDNGMTMDNGTVSLESTNSATDLRIRGAAGATSTLDGSGEVIFAGTAAIDTANEIEVFDSTHELVIGPDITVRTGTSGGRIRHRVNNGTIRIQGTVISDLSGRAIQLSTTPLILEGSLQASNNAEIELWEDWTNTGTMTITDSLLDIGNTVNDVWDNNGTITLDNGIVELGGTFTADDVGALNGTGTSIILGNLDNTGQALDIATDLGTPTVTLGTNGKILNGSIVSTPLTVPSNVNFTFDGIAPLSADVTIANAGVLTIENDLTLDNVTITLTSNNSATDLRFRGPAGGTSMLDGTGEVVFGGTTTTDTANDIEAFDSLNSLTIGAGITIRTGTTGGRIRQRVSNATVRILGTVIVDAPGRTVQMSAAPLLLEGTITVSNGGELELFGDWINTGTITLTDSLLDIGNTATSTFDNNGTIMLVNSDIEVDGIFTVADVGNVTGTGNIIIEGTLDNTGLVLDVGTVGTGSVVLATGGVILGGTIANTPLVVASAVNFTFDGVTLNVDLTVENSGVLTLENDLTLNATITLASSNSATDLRFRGANGATSTFDGTGEVIFGGTASIDTANEIEVFDSGHGLTIGAGITVRSGTAGGRIRQRLSNSLVTIQGSVLADLAGRTLTLEAGPLLIDTANVQVTNGAELELFGNWTNIGTIALTDSVLDIANQIGNNWDNNGTITLTNSEVFLGGTFTFADIGAMTGTGTTFLDGTLDNTGLSLDLGTLATGTVVLDNTGKIIGGTITTTPASLTSGDVFTLDGVILDTDITVENGAVLSIENGLVLNATVTLASANSATDLRFRGPNGGTSMLDGAGEVVFGGTATVDTANEIEAFDSGHALTIGAGITVRTDTAGGRIRHRLGNAQITILGTVTVNLAGRKVVFDADPTSIDTSNIQVSNGAELELFGDWINNGTITLTDSVLDIASAATDSWDNNGTITLTNTDVFLGGTFTFANVGAMTGTGTTILDGTLDNTGQSLDLGALATGTVVLESGGTITGGTITTTPFSILTSDTFTLDAVTLDTNVTIDNGAVLSIENDLTLNATITLGSDGSATDLRFRGTNGTNSTLDGTGNVVFGGTAVFDNTNDIEAFESGHGLVIGSGITIETGTSAGRIRQRVSNAQVTIEGTVINDLPDRTVTLSGSQVSVEGNLHAGAGSTIDLGSDYVLASTAALDVDIGGTAASDFGRYTSPGDATLGGTLNIALVNGFMPVLGNTFEIMTFATRSGTFATVNGTGIGGGLFFTPGYDVADVTLEVTN